MPAEPIKLIAVNNPVDVEDRIIRRIPFRRQQLRTLQRKYMPRHGDLNVHVNQRRVPKDEQKNWRLHPGDEVIMVPALRDPGSLWAISLWVTGGTVSVATYAAFAALYVGIAVGTGYLIRALGPKPEAPEAAGPQAFTWNPVTRQQQGLSIARAYGKNKFYGNILSSWTVPDGLSETLCLVLGLNEGPDKGIVADSICFQDQPAGNFGNIITHERKGTFDQTAIFNAEKLEYRPNRRVKNADGPLVWTTPDNDYDKLEIALQYSGFHYLDSGKNNGDNIRAKIEISEHDEESWDTLCDIILWSTKNPASRQKNFISDQSYTGGSPVTITNGKRYDIRVTCVYEDRAEDDTHRQRYLTLSSVREVISTAFKRPGLSLLGVEALATDKISGNLKVSCVQECRVVNVYNGTSWTIGYTTNPSWVIWDIMTQPVISGDGSGPNPYVIERYDGVDPNRLIPSLQKFYEFAEWCDQMVSDGEGGTEKRIEFNGSFDEGSNMWAAVKEVCSMSRCEIIQEGINYTIIVDKAWTGEPVQLFSAGNMQPGTFGRDYLPLEDRAAEIEITFRDASQDYEMVPLTFYDSGIGNPNKKIAIKARGVNKISQAWRMAYYELAKNRLIKSVSAFETDVDAIVCKKGDVINVAPPWRRDGRVVSCPSNNQVILDAPKMGSGNDTLIVRSRDPATGDDKVETHTVASVDGAVVTISGTWTIQPKINDVYAFGPTAKLIQKHRVVGIGAGEELRHKIAVAEYHAGVYSGDEGEPVIPIGNYITPQSVPDRTRPPTLNQLTRTWTDESLKQSNYDIPLRTNLKWNNNTPSSGYVSWSKEDETNPILFTLNGTTYEITPDSTTDEFIYWDPNYTTQFRTTNLISEATIAGNWLMCRNVDGVAHPADGMLLAQIGILLAGFLKVGTADIENLAVNTLQIADHAVTGSGWAYTQGAIDFGASEVTVQSIEFTTTGENLAITFVAPIKKLTGDYNNFLYSLRLYRDTTQIYESQLYFHEAYVPSAFIAEDTPTAGTYTYAVKVIRVHTVTGRLKDRALRINEYKK